MKAICIVLASLAYGISCGGAASSQSAVDSHSKTGSHFDWSYGGNTGPDQWGEIRPEYAMCKAGHNQSPVDLTQAVVAELAPPAFNYTPMVLDLLNNGHTLQVSQKLDNALTIDGNGYHLVQFHFHSPSEHRVDGDNHAMEAHIVHQSDDGQLAVLGILMNEGKENPFVASLWGVEATHGERTTVEHIQINVGNLIPADKTHFRYSGSLTTPPCTEGVHWIVFKNAIEISAAQVAKFKDIFELSARPVQPLHSRSIMRTN